MPLTVPAGLRTFASENVAGNATAGQSAFGNRSVYLGVGAGQFAGTDPTDEANDNVVIGYQAGANIDADGNVILGRAAMGGVALPPNRVAIGLEAGPINGAQVHAGNEGGVYIGTRAARNMGQAANAGDGVGVVIGFEAGEFQGGSFHRNCVFIGRRAARNNLLNVAANSQNAVVIGTEACEQNFQGTNNSVCIGYRAGRGSGLNGTANGCVFIGSLVGEDVTTGVNNVGIGGTGCLQNLTGGTGNIAIGNNAMQNASTAGQNICMGLNAGVNLSSGVLNIFMGDDMTGGNGNSNIVLSPDGAMNTGSFSVILGYRVQVPAGDGLFMVESIGSAGVNRRSFLYGEMSDGNLILGNSTLASGVPNNRDTGGGANTLKIQDVQAPLFGATGPPTANPVGGSFQWFDSAAGVGAVGAHQWRLPSGVIVTLGDVPSVTGSRAANAALASLLTVLAASGIVTDNTVI